MKIRLSALGTLLLACSAGLAGCHSAFIQATVVNATSDPVRLFELDYPGASFGSGELGQGARFGYKFKVLGTGPSKILWTDASGKDHTGKGPDLHDGQEGTLVVTLEADSARWDAHLRQAP